MTLRVSDQSTNPAARKASEELKRRARRQRSWGTPNISIQFIFDKSLNDLTERIFQETKYQVDF